MKFTEKGLKEVQIDLEKVAIEADAVEFLQKISEIPMPRYFLVAACETEINSLLTEGIEKVSKEDLKFGAICAMVAHVAEVLVDTRILLEKIREEEKAD